MIHRVEIRPRQGFGDPHADGVFTLIRELGIASVSAVRSVRLFFLAGELSADDARRVAGELLTDPVVEEFSIPLPNGAGPDDPQSAIPNPQSSPSVIEVHRKPGVMDPVAASTEDAIRGMGMAISSVSTGRRYELDGAVADAEKETVARKLLANPVIEDIYYAAHTPAEVHGLKYELNIVTVPIRDLDDAGLVELSRKGDMFLNLVEMKGIQDYFRRIGREPRDVELEMIAQTWSEHCVHKTFRSDVVVRDLAGREVERVENLIKSTVFAVTERLNKPWCISVFKDNAGVIEFDEKHAVCFKVETHNHPSAIEPYGGAATGIGGVVRDPMGTGLGAQPVANTDVFCFGPPEVDLSAVPKGVLHPRRVMRGVVAGVRDYGNRMGIPTVNGAVYFDEKYMGNPLVYCGTVGLMDRAKCFKNARLGDAVVVVGGRTGRDGIHGATFSSGELTHVHETAFSHAVQIGNAITEKKMLDTILQARDLDLFSAITDCGAGGLSSAIGEMGEELGAEVHIDRVPLKYQGLSYAETWISEAQERMVLAVPQANLERILKLFADEGVEATVLGHYGVFVDEGAEASRLCSETPDQGRDAPATTFARRPLLRLLYAGQLVGELEMGFLHQGLPRPLKEAVYEKVNRPSPLPPARSDYSESLLKILASPNVASKEWIIRQYDHEVQGGSVVKPLVGVGSGGPGDASVVRPVLSSRKGVTLSCGMNPRLGDLDPYQSALHAVDEALRNNVAVGGNLDRMAILDNFCWGNCNKPDRMGSLVQSAKGCRDAAMAYGTPFISGKDSLNNEFQTEGGQTIAIPPTLLISAISVIDSADKCVTADAKRSGNHLMLLGRTGGEMGGSHLLMVEGVATGNDVPTVDLQANFRVMKALQAAIEAGLVRACHDLSEGGLAVAAAEMAFSGGLGVELDLGAVPLLRSAASVPVAALLFAEHAGRFLVEVAPESYDAFMRTVRSCPVGELGRVTATGRVIIRHSGRAVIDVDIRAAKDAWRKTFDW